MSAHTLRIAILGTGHMAQTMAASIGRASELEVAGFASRDSGRAEAMAARFGGRGYAALDAVLADGSIDALYIANESAAHAAAAVAALTAGKPVLCEKPCAIDAAGARAIAETARRTGTLFMEAIATPFLPAMAAVLDAVASGGLGPIRQLSASFGYPADAASHPGCFAAEGGGVLLDRAIYLVVLARLALGPMESIDAAIRWRDGIDVEAALLTRHADGVIATLTASFGSELDNRLTISGTGGVATVEAPLLAAEAYRISHYGVLGREAPGGGLSARLRQNKVARKAVRLARLMRTPHLSHGGDPYAWELAHFGDLLRSGAQESPVLPPSLSVEVMEALDRARAAGR